MSWETTPQKLRHEVSVLAPQLSDWLRCWLSEHTLSKNLPEALVAQQLALHWHLKDQAALFHLSKDQQHTCWFLHAGVELLQDLPQSELFSAENTCFLGQKTFFLATPHQLLIEKIKSAYGALKELKLCSSQACLLPEHGQLIEHLPHSPSGALEQDLKVQISFTGLLKSGQAHFECYLIQPKNQYSLSMLVSLLENFGLQAEKNYFYDIPQKSAWSMTSFTLVAQNEHALISDRPTGETMASLIEDAMTQIARQRVENDPLHRLIIEAGLDWRRIELLRAWLRYLWQVKCPISFSYATELLIAHAPIAQKIVEFFHWRFLPSHDLTYAMELSEEKQTALLATLEDLISPDADILLRKLIELVSAIVRTNYYQTMPDGLAKSWLSFKINPAKLTDLPEPLMAHEIFVYHYHMEGIHLRTSDIARGGIRWSDRLEDYRTEVLALVKAQQSKNSIILPSGAKGAFIVRTQGLPPEDQQKLTLACYQIFIRGLLDLTDNRRGNTVQKPPQTCCWDADDPYLVVAADKGTAAFSDHANALAHEYDFWLGDAFASGGSQGYDHKKLGITAKGAFVSLKHHLRDLQIDPQTDPITAIGIGDLSGDVFGNGALQIPSIKWRAAFNHRHIFLDPSPLPQAHAERQRLFLKGRGSWDDFNPELISQGGGVFSRQQKSITLSKEVQDMLGTTAQRLPPHAMIALILKMKADLLFNGGIGTYVKCASESDFDAADRQNDLCRVNAQDLQCQIVVEGGNLGVTQKGRIAFARHNKGRINTDTLDNSGGVDCSDHEVNIKILVQCAIERELLSQEQRPALLASLAEPITQKVLEHNQRQNQIISQMAWSAPSDLRLHNQLITDLCSRGKLNRAFESLPSLKEVEQRLISGQGLSRPELIVLLAFIKLDLCETLETCDLNKILMKERYLIEYFPTDIATKFDSILNEHPLANKIIICTLVNRFVDDLGVAFFYRMRAETQAQPEDLFSAYTWVREIIQFDKRRALIESLPHTIAPEHRYTLHNQLQRLFYRCVRWVLKNIPLEEMTEQRQIALRELFQAYLSYLNQADEEQLKDLCECPAAITAISTCVPPEIWRQLCFFTRLKPMLALQHWAPEDKESWGPLFDRYDLTALTLKLHHIYQAVNALPVSSQWEALARSELREKIEECQVKLTRKFYRNWAATIESTWFLNFWNQQVESYFSLASRDFVQSFVLINHLELLLKGR